MAKKNNQYDIIEEEVSGYFQNLSGSKRREMLGIWNQSGPLYRKYDDSAPNEAKTEEALNLLHKKLGFPEAENDAEQKDNRPFWILLAAAAVLMALGTAWLLNPVTYTVPAGQTMAIELRDGSTVTANSGSILSHSRTYGFTNRSVALNGEAFFEVVSGDNPFRVKANGTITEVLGTSFNLRSWSTDPGRKTSLSVVSGKVNFYAEKKNDVVRVLTAGYSSSMQDTWNQPADPVQITLQHALAWKENNLAFSVQPLSVIFAELERKFDVVIEWNESGIAETTLTTFYTEPENVESVLSDICTVKGLTYARTADGYRVSYQ